jgi:hypothetical protein
MLFNRSIMAALGSRARDTCFRACTGSWNLVVFRGYQPLKVKQLGWSEMLQGVVFGILLATLFFTAN